MKRNKFTLRIADISIRIDLSRVQDQTIVSVLREQISLFYAKEIIHAQKKPDYTIYYIAEEEYTLIKQRKNNETGTTFYMQTCRIEENTAYIHYHVSMAQFQFLLKMILQRLLTERSGFILHCSGIIHKGHAFLFLGPNGIGKSTIVENLTQNYTPFADDMVVIRKIARRWHAFQLPLEKKPYKTKPNEFFPVRAICYLEQGNTSRLQVVPHQKAGKKLLQQLVQQGSSEQQVAFVLEFLAKTDHYLLKTPLKTDLSVIENLVKRYR